MKPLATINHWYIFISDTGHLHLSGIVKGHSRLSDGSSVITTRIVLFEKDGDLVIAETRNTRYELLDSDEDFNYIVPDFKKKIVAGPVPGYYDFITSDYSE